MKAVILCAGNGERLKPITDLIPKSLILINQKPILAYIFNSLPSSTEEVFLVIKKRNLDFFKKFLETFNFSQKVTFLFQDEDQKGTYYALKTAEDFLRNEEKFLVLNGDDLFLKRDLENILEKKVPCYGLSYRKLDFRYRTCDLDLENNKILSFRKQKEVEIGQSVPCFSGALTLNNSFFNYSPVFYENQEAGIPHTLFGNNHNVYFYILKEWIQINNKEDIDKANLYFKNKK